MMISYYDLLNKIDYGYFKIYDIYSDTIDFDRHKELLLKRIPNFNTRIDVLSRELNGNDGLFWILVLLNFDEIDSIFGINQDLVTNINHYKKSLMLEPIEFIYSEVFDVINSVILDVLKMIQYIKDGYVDPTDYILHANEILLDILKNIKSIYIPTKGDITINDQIEQDNLNTYKNIVYNSINNDTLFSEVISIDVDDFDYSNGALYNVVSPDININNIKSGLNFIINSFRYVLWWCDNTIDYKEYNEIMQ